VLQIVINNRLPKRHQNSTLSAISRRDIITWTLIVLGISLPLSKFTQSSTHNCYSNSEQYTVASAHVFLWRHYNLSFPFIADDKFVLQNMLKGGEWIIKVFLFTKLLLKTLTTNSNVCIKIYYHCGHSARRLKPIHCIRCIHTRSIQNRSRRVFFPNRTSFSIKRAVDSMSSP
jgi:hypothetical protein